MAVNDFDNYMRWITPKPGDPTYSILKAHLLFEELLRAQLARVLPNASALTGARLTFAQLLAVTRAATVDVPRERWIWIAIANLNKIRNLLSHETNPKDLRKQIDAYVKYLEHNLAVSLPPALADHGAAHGTRWVTAIDVVTMPLYYIAASHFGFDIKPVLEKEKSRKASSKSKGQ